MSFGASAVVDVCPGDHPTGLSMVVCRFPVRNSSISPQSSSSTLSLSGDHRRFLPEIRRQGDPQEGCPSHIERHLGQASMISQGFTFEVINAPVAPRGGGHWCPMLLQLRGGGPGCVGSMLWFPFSFCCSSIPHASIFGGKLGARLLASLVVPGITSDLINGKCSEAAVPGHHDSLRFPHYLEAQRGPPSRILLASAARDSRRAAKTSPNLCSESLRKQPSNH